LSKPPFKVDPLTQERQRRAADPEVSAWVSANAGAGKTKVLTDRVVRLLLSGTPPGRILCLTFTKAAAANMAIRVFDRLGRWVTLDDAALAEDLERLTGKPTSRAQLDDSRRLFARSVETPGGLKIETLHALCERLLHMFPFEANVPAGFTVLDDDEARAAFESATDATLADAALGRLPGIREAHARITPEAQDDTLRDLIRAAIRARRFLARDGRLDLTFAGLAQALGWRRARTSRRSPGASSQGFPISRPSARCWPRQAPRPTPSSPDSWRPPSTSPAGRRPPASSPRPSRRRSSCSSPARRSRRPIPRWAPRRPALRRRPRSALSATG